MIDPTNEDANFGAGVLGLLVLTSDPEVNAAFDEWKTYLESHTPFEVGGGALQPLGISIAPTGDRAALALPFQAVPFSLLAESRTALAGADPQIGRVQAILSERALPRLTEAIARLQVVGRDPSYRFIVSPRMQGDTRAHPIEIDQTDILALHAGAELLSSIVHAAVAYELGFAAYDSASLVHALTPGSGWLALRAGGAEHLRAAGADLRASIDGVEETIDALLAETDDPTDDQSDDLIKVGNGRADVESLKVHLPQARAALTTGYAFVGDWDRDPGTPKTSLRIKAGALFDTPIPDWKALLPAYTVSTVRRSRRIQYVSQYGATHDTVSVLRADFYHGYYSYSYSGGSGSEFYDGDPQVRAPLRRVILGLLHEAEQQRGWNGTFFGTGNFADSLPSVVTTTIEVSWFQEYTLAPSQVVVPVITWDAPTFAEWHWPDPTLGGLLPELDDPNQLDAMFGIDAGNWTPRAGARLDAGAADRRLAARRPRTRGGRHDVASSLGHADDRARHAAVPRGGDAAMRSARPSRRPLVLRIGCVIAVLGVASPVVADPIELLSPGSHASVGLGGDPFLSSLRDETGWWSERGFARGPECDDGGVVQSAGVAQHARRRFARASRGVVDRASRPRARRSHRDCRACRAADLAGIVERRSGVVWRSGARGPRSSWRRASRPGRRRSRSRSTRPRSPPMPRRAARREGRGCASTAAVGSRSRRAGAACGRPGARDRGPRRGLRRVAQPALRRLPTRRPVGTRPVARDRGVGGAVAPAVAAGAGRLRRLRDRAARPRRSRADRTARAAHRAHPCARALDAPPPRRRRVAAPGRHDVRRAREARAAISSPCCSVSSGATGRAPASCWREHARGSASARGEVESWPFTAALVDLLGLRGIGTVDASLRWSRLHAAIERGIGRSLDLRGGLGFYDLEPDAIVGVVAPDVPGVRSRRPRDPPS